MPGKLEVSAVEVRLSPGVGEILWLVEQSGGRDRAWSSAAVSGGEGVILRLADCGGRSENPEYRSHCLDGNVMKWQKERTEWWKTRENEEWRTVEETLDCTMITWENVQILINGTHKEFDEIKRNDNVPSDSEFQTMIGQLEMGDLILRRIDSCETFYHVGLYIGRELVIEFTAPADPKFPPASTVLCSSSCKGGLVSMKSVKHFIGQKPYCILRLKTRDIPQTFSQRVQEMMHYDGDYNVLNNNCLHFALRLLGLQSRPLITSQPNTAVAMEDLGERSGFLKEDQ